MPSGPQAETPPEDPVGFDYSALPADVGRWLRETHGVIRLLSRNLTRDLLTMGSWMTQIRDRLEYGRFNDWVNQETAFSTASVYRWMGAAVEWKDFPHVANFEPTALYLLTGPRIPQWAKLAAKGLAESGQRVTAADARSILAQVAEPSKKLVRKLAPLQPADVAETRAANLAGAAPVVIPGPTLSTTIATVPATPDQREGRAWEMLKTLWRAGGSIHLVGLPDADDPTAVSFSGTLYPGDGGPPRRACRETEAEVVLALAGAEPMKQCRNPKCRSPLKPLGAFPRDANAKDGHFRFCKDCERPRIQRAKRRMKARRKAAEAAAQVAATRSPAAPVGAGADGGSGGGGI